MQCLLSEVILGIDRNVHEISQLLGIGLKGPSEGVGAIWLYRPGDWFLHTTSNSPQVDRKQLPKPGENHTA